MFDEGLVEYLTNYKDYDEAQVLAKGDLRDCMEQIFQTTGNERLIIPKGEYEDYVRFWKQTLEDE